MNDNNNRSSKVNLINVIKENSDIIKKNILLAVKILATLFFISTNIFILITIIPLKSLFEPISFGFRYFIIILIVLSIVSLLTPRVAINTAATSLAPLITLFILFLQSPDYSSQELLDLLGIPLLVLSILYGLMVFGINLAYIFLKTINIESENRLIRFYFKV